jgi:transcriptional regulator with XRE-family HTH domain
MIEVGASLLIHRILMSGDIPQLGAFGEVLRVARQERGLKQMYVSLTCGVSLHQVKMWEGGKQSPGVRSIVRVIEGCPWLTERMETALFPPFAQSISDTNLELATP